MRVGVAEHRSVLIISSWADDHASLRTIFRNSPWQLREAITGGEGLVALRNDPRGIPVVICEHDLPDGDWKCLLAEVVDMPIRPSLIVFFAPGRRAAMGGGTQPGSVRPLGG